MTDRTTTSRGFVVRSVDYGDSDRILTLYTRELGKISVRARGARKSRKRYQGAFEPFVLIETLLEKARGDIWHAKEARAIEVFAHLGQRLDLYNSASHLVEFAREIVPEHEVDHTMFDLLLETLRAFAMVPETFVIHRLMHTQLKMLTHAGCGLHTDACSVCRTPVPDGRSVFIDYERGGIVCSPCGGGPLRLAAKVATVLRHLNQPEFDTSKLEPFDDSTVHDLFGLITHFAEHNFGCRIRTSPF